MNRFIPISQPSITQAEIDCVTDAVRSGWVSSLGQYIDKFEAEFARFCGSKYAVAVSNGTTALHLALVSCGVGQGDDVIVPDLTFVATANAVRYSGAGVVFADIEPDTLCLDPKSVEPLISSRTKAIIPVHLYGHPAKMDELKKIASKHDLMVIEDAAEAHGAEVDGKRVGSLGHCAVFSFYGNKIVTTGEGGMITTDDQAIYLQAKVLRDHAMSAEKRYWHEQIGFNYRMTNMQAALGFAQMERIDEILQRKRAIIDLYRHLLLPNSRLKLNYQASWARNVYWMVCLEIDGLTDSTRARLMTRLKQKGVDSRPYFYPISDMPMYEKADTPVAHYVYERGINLPSFFDITDDEIQYVCQSVLAVLQEI